MHRSDIPLTSFFPSVQYLETMAEMRNPADFKKSLIVFSVTIVVVYLWSALSLYFRYGQTVYSSTLYNLDGGPLKTAASLRSASASCFLSIPI